MQIAIAEMLTFPNIPVSVTINEYVELAKIYSTPRSGGYINGMLDAIARFLISTQKMFKSMDEPKSKRQEAEADDDADSDDTPVTSDNQEDVTSTEAAPAEEKAADEETPAPVKRRPGRPRKNAVKE